MLEKITIMAVLAFGVLLFNHLRLRSRFKRMNTRLDEMAILWNLNLDDHKRMINVQIRQLKRRIGKRRNDNV